jgi:GrpB-like predicted nucleotidyltransferase (UPF0157 family)
MTAVTGASDADFETGVIGGPTLHDDTIRLVEHDPAWPERFEQGAARIRALLGPAALRVDHVGSTSVPGLAAKPIIDVVLTVVDSSDVRHTAGPDCSEASISQAAMPCTIGTRAPHAGDRGRGGCALSAVDDAAGRDYVARLSDCGQAVDKRRSVRHASRPAPRGRSS